MLHVAEAVSLTRLERVNSMDPPRLALLTDVFIFFSFSIHLPMAEKVNRR